MRRKITGCPARASETFTRAVNKQAIYSRCVCLHLGFCLISSVAGDTHHGIQQREGGQVEEGLPRLLSHRLIHVVQLIDDVVA